MFVLTPIPPALSSEFLATFLGVGMDISWNATILSSCLLGERGLVVCKVNWFLSSPCPGLVPSYL